MPNPGVIQTVIDIGGRISPSLQKAVGEANRQLRSGLVKGGFVAALGAAGAAALKLAKDYREATRTLVAGTGATGEALRGLQADVAAVMGRGVPASVNEAARAVADYNTLLGASGETVRELAETTAKAAKVWGEDLTGLVAANSKALNAWGLSAEDGARAVDYLSAVSQATGRSMTELASDTARNAGVLKQLGYGYEQSVALLGQMGKAGADANAVLSGLSVAMRKGLTPEKWVGLNEAIKGAASESQALALAVNEMGLKGAAAVQTVRAIRAGATDVGALMEASAGFAGNVERTYRATRTLGDALQELQGRFGATFGPKLEEWATQAVDFLTATMNDLWERGGDALLDMLSTSWEAVKRLWTGTALPWIRENVFDPILEPFRDMERAWEAVKSTAAGVAEAFAGLVHDFDRFMVGVEKSLGESAFGKAWNAAASLFGMDAKAAGGFVTSPSICGEAGPEAVISFDPAYRAQNVAYWQRAGAALGVQPSGGVTYDLSGMVFAPTVGAGATADVMAELRANEAEFADLVVASLSARDSRRY